MTIDGTNEQKILVVNISDNLHILIKFTRQDARHSLTFIFIYLPYTCIVFTWTSWAVRLLKQNLIKLLIIPVIIMELRVIIKQGRPWTTVFFFSFTGKIIQLIPSLKKVGADDLKSTQSSYVTRNSDSKTTETTTISSKKHKKPVMPEISFVPYRNKPDPELDVSPGEIILTKFLLQVHPEVSDQYYHGSST